MLRRSIVRPFPVDSEGPRVKPSSSLSRSTKEPRSPESCSSFRSSEEPHPGFTTVVLGRPTRASLGVLRVSSLRPWLWRVGVPSCAGRRCREDGWTRQSRVTWVILDVWCVRDRANNGRTGPTILSTLRPTDYLLKRLNGSDNSAWERRTAVMTGINEHVQSRGRTGRRVPSASWRRLRARTTRAALRSGNRANRCASARIGGCGWARWSS